MKKILFIVLSLLLVLTSFATTFRYVETTAYAADSIETLPFEGDLGSARSLYGTTVIFSIYASDGDSAWNNDSKNDRERINDTLDNINIAVKWLSNQVDRYGKTASFIWNWKDNADLRYFAEFKESYQLYEDQRDWVLSNIDSESVKAKYDADNIVYLFFFNANYRDAIAQTYDHSSGPDTDVELCNIYVRSSDCGWVTSPSPATYAHEIMHCFGAPDLYETSDLIPESYVNHCETSQSEDIMYSVWSLVGSKSIASNFTDLDAYYTGVIDYCAEVTEWDLTESEHVALQTDSATIAVKARKRALGLSKDVTYSANMKTDCDDAEIYWFINNEVVAFGKRYTVYGSAGGYTIQAKVLDCHYRVISESETSEVTAKESAFTSLKSFFNNLINI